MKSLVMAAVAALCCVAYADGPEGGARPEGGPRGFGPREGMGQTMSMMRGMGGMDPVVRAVSNPAIAEKLGLSEEQKAKIKAANGTPEANREAQKKIRDASMKQAELMRAEKVDEAAVMAAIDEVFDLRKAMAKAQAKRTITIKSILTPEQVKKAQEEMKNGVAPRGEHGHRRGSPREGMGPQGARGPRGDGNMPPPPPKPEAM